MNENGLAGQGEQLLSSAFVFGSSAIVFASMPFIFIVARGLLKANDPQTRSSSIIGTFTFAYVIHFLSCLGFYTTILVLDSLKTIYGTSHFQNVVFPIFWKRGKDAVLSAAGLTGGNITIEAESAYLTLFVTQTVVDFVLIVLPVFVFLLGMAYGVYQSKKDVYREDTITTIIWTIGGGIIASFLFFLWIKIAEIAIFYDGSLLEMIRSSWKTILKI